MSDLSSPAPGAALLRFPDGSELRLNRAGLVRLYHEGREPEQWPVPGSPGAAKVQRLGREVAVGSWSEATVLPALAPFVEAERARIAAAQAEEDRARAAREAEQARYNAARARIEQAFGDATRGWKRGTYSITVGKDGHREERTGLVKGNLWGLTKEPHGWTLTHRPSGLAAHGPSIGSPATLKILAARLAEVPDMLGRGRDQCHAIVVAVRNHGPFAPTRYDLPRGSA